MNLKFWKKQQRDNIENPSTPLSAQNIEGGLIASMGFGGGRTKAGSAVNPDSALSYSAIYAAIRLLSETVAQLPLVLYQKSESKRTPAVDHPLYALTHSNPSERLTSFVWRETQMHHVLAWGNGYAYIERARGVDTPIAMRILSPKETRAEVTNGRLSYVVTIKGREYDVDPADMIHIPAMGTDGVAGKSPITLHRETIGLSMRATEFGAEFFGNGASLGGVLKHPAGLGKEGRINLKNAWDRLKGSGYQGVAVLEEGMDYTRIGIPPNDAQFIETRKFQISEIARIYNVPPHMLRDLEKSSFNNIAEQSIEFLRYTMTPWLVKWEQELNRKLLTTSELAAGYYFKFNTGGLLRGTQADRYEAYGKGINDGWLLRNEARELEDMDPIEGLDDPLMPLNMVVVGRQPEEQEAPAEGQNGGPSADIERFMPMIDRAAAALVAFDARCLQNSKGVQGDMLSRYVAGAPGMLERHIEPMIKSFDADQCSRLVSSIGKALGDYRQQSGTDPLSLDILKQILIDRMTGHES